MGTVKRVRRLLAPILGAITAMLIVGGPALGYAYPYDWYTLSRTDVLNFEWTGPWGDYWTVSNLMGGVQWRNATMSGQYADVAYPSQYVVQDNSLAKYGDDTLFCTTYRCRNHARLWGLPFRNSTDSISTVSEEHWPGWGDAFTHYVDTFSGGRDDLFWDLWPLAWIRSGWWTTQYSSGCMGQPDGSCAPYDGQVAYQCVSNDFNSPCQSSSPAGATSTSATTATRTKPIGEIGIIVPISSPPSNLPARETITIGR